LHFLYTVQQEGRKTPSIAEEDDPASHGGGAKCQKVRADEEPARDIETSSTSPIAQPETLDTSMGKSPAYHATVLESSPSLSMLAPAMMFLHGSVNMTKQCSLMWPCKQTCGSLKMPPFW